MSAFARLVERAGYGLLQSPMFEDLAVFQRMGEGTDVVRKEMYDFRDKGDRHLALRPEGTASVVRAYVQHRPPTPWKTWYVTPSFRYEAVQKGRLRQHHQLGIEAIGPMDPDLDVEVIALLWDFFGGLGLRDLRLVVNSMGGLESRPRYLERLRSHLREHEAALDPEDREKIDPFPMRVLDSKRPASRAVVDDAPMLLDELDAGSAAHFERVQGGLRALGIPFEIDPRLVRGLDYYTHTAFEVKSDALEAAQNTIGGGGRYDGLVESLGGPPTPGIGFGAGIERILLACDHEGVFPVPDTSVQVFVVDTTGGGQARDLTTELRRRGLSVDRAFEGRSMKAQMKAANRSGAAIAAIVGDDELAAGTVTLRLLREEREQEQVSRTELIDALEKLLS